MYYHRNYGNHHQNYDDISDHGVLNETDHIRNNDNHNHDQKENNKLNGENKLSLKTDHEDQKDGARAYGHQGFQHKPDNNNLLTVKIDWL